MKLASLLSKLGASEMSAVPSDGTLTTDKQLLSLRRQRRLMDEREEKEFLRQELRRRALARDRAIFDVPKKRVGERTILSRLPSVRQKRFASARSDL
jgi:hypothetical protein